MAMILRGQIDLSSRGPGDLIDGSIMGPIQALPLGLIAVQQPKETCE